MTKETPTPKSPRKGPRPADTYRGVRRNAFLREHKRPADARPWQTSPNRFRLDPARFYIKRKSYPRSGDRECARRRGDL